MEGSEFETGNELPSSIDQLPTLKEGFVRLVHITNPEVIDQIKGKGLNYENQGMVSSIARAYLKQEDVEYSSSDPRYSKQGLKAVVIDVPLAEYNLYNNVIKSPGIVPSNYIVGIVDINN